MVCGETGWERGTVDVALMQYAEYAVPSVFCTPCMLYSVLPLDHGME